MAFLASGKSGGASGKFSSLFLAGCIFSASVLSISAHANTCELLFKNEVDGTFQGSSISEGAAPEVVRQTTRQTVTPKGSRAKVAKPVMEVPRDEVKPVIEMLAGIDKLTNADVTSKILGERLTLKDMLAASDTKNLAVRSPFTIMNAAQRMLALIYSQGKKQVRLQVTGEEVTEYGFFSKGTAATNGFRVFGAEKAIGTFVNNLVAQAKGDRSASSLVLLVGSHGTGKSETLKLLGLASENMTSQEDPKFASWTYKWTKLGEIPELQKFIASSVVDGKKVFSDLEAPLGDSPYTLLPTDVQALVVEKARKQASDLIDGMAPAPFESADPISHFIRNEIIQHYAQKRGHPLSAAEIVDVLNDHIEVKRQIIGPSYGKMPLIDASGNDIDVAGLFMAPNPSVRFTTGGPSHVMAWFLNGKILAGHGNAVLFDEFFRNPQELRDMLLGAFESRRLNVNGAPSVPFDAVMIAATNTANLKDVTSDAKGAAAADRFKKTGMRWSVYPNEVAQLLLGGKQSELRQQSLAEENAPVVKGNIDDLIPRTEGLNKIQTSDYRYKVFFGEGSKKVEVAPHTILMMAEIIAATRLEIDPAKAEREFKGKILTSNLLRNPIDRLRLYEGLKTEVQSDEIRELSEVSTLLKEGETGMSARDAARWLTDAIVAASNERTGYTLTPGIALRVLRTMLSEGSITTSSAKERLRWLELTKEVVAQMLVPRLDSDISRGLANGDRVVNEAYFDILDEMYAIHKNPNATEFKSSRTGQDMAIDRPRLQKIAEIYQKRNGQPLNISQIAIFHSQQATAGNGVGRTPDASLLEAVAAQYGELNSQLAGFNSLVEFERTGVGDDSTQAGHASLKAALRAMGYNDLAFRDALMLIKHQRSQSQVPPQ